MFHKQTRRFDLAESRPGARGPRTAVAYDTERRELQADLVGMVPKGERVRLSPLMRNRFNEYAREGAPRSPAMELVEAAFAAVALGRDESAVCAVFERMLSIVRARCRAAQPLADTTTAEITMLRESGETHVAVRLYAAEPHDSPRKRALGVAAVREILEERAALTTLHDRIREDVVLQFPRVFTVR